MFRDKLKPLYLAGLLDLCVLAPAFAQSGATQQLVNQGNYWHDQGRDDLAADVWRKLLAVDPAQPDALLGLGMIDLAQGHAQQARQRLQLLQARHPGAPQTQRLRVAVEGGTAGGDANLANARRASAAGRYADAVRSYEALFNGHAPPADLALEYYQALAGTPAGWDKARTGLAGLHAARPNDTAVALALAQVLTYREPTRREGIAQLQALAGQGAAAGPARRGWRQALLWLDARSGDAGLYQAYLAGSPGDGEVQAKLDALGRQAAASGARDQNAERLGEGFKALNGDDLAGGERRFLQVLKDHPRDAEALGGLGSVRLRQKRFSEAQELLRQAAASDGKWKSAYDSARYWQLLQQAQARAEAGDTDQAQALLRQALPLQPREPTGHVVLAGLQAASDPAAAEAGYRAALALDADNTGALQGLADLYSRQGRLDEANRYFSRLPASARAQAGGETRLQSNARRAAARQALAEGDAATAQRELEAAMVEQPGDPWIRLDLARLYQQSGRPDQARSVMDGLLAVHGDMPEALYANALLAEQAGDWAGAYASLERIPAASRDEAMNRLHDSAWIELQARQARQLQAQGRLAEAQLLLSRTESSLSDRLDQPALLAALAGAWADAGNVQRALVLAQRLVAGGNVDTEDRLLYAGVLLRAHQDAELAAVLRQLQALTMTPDQLSRYNQLRTGYTLRQVDALRELGNLEGAYDILAPLLAQQPQDPQVLSALARLYSSAGDQGQALAIYRQVLQRQPADLDTLVAAANAAAAQSDLRSAQAYLDRALAQAPDSPDVLAAAGRMYRAAGKDRKAAQYFRAALAAQQRQGGAADNGLPAARGTAVGASGRPLNPFAGMTGGVPVSAAVISAPAGPAGAGLPPVAAAASLPPAGGYTADGGLPAPVAVSSTGTAALPVPATPRTARSRLVAADVLVPSAVPASVGTPAGAPVQDSLVDELRQVQSAASSQVAGGAAYRSRDGESGLGRLDDIEMPIQAEFAVGEGKLGVGITPTLVDAGAVGTDYSRASRFGAGPAAALADALAADATKIDTLVGSTLYQGLLTEGESTATRNFIYDAAVASGAFQTLYNEAEGDTTAERRQAALDALYAAPLSQYLLSHDVSSLSIGTIATQVLGDSSIAADLDATSAAMLKSLAASSAATLTPVQFRDAMYSMAAAGNGSRRMSQDDTGVGVALSYRNGGFSADVGTTPLGFQQSNVVGGVGYRGQAGRLFTWTAEASRRAVSDSVLSFAGTRDPRTGREWGGVTSNGAWVSGTLDNGLLGGYVNLAAHRITGRNVADNDHRQVDLGFYVHALQTENQSLTAGVNLTAMQYDKNLSGYTYGHGGYFSPQQYFDLGFPVHWSGRSAGQKVNWRVDASVGVQHFRTDATPYFPTDATLQQAAYDAASIAALLGLTSEYVAPVYDGQNRTGVSYNLSGAAEWQVAPQLFLGGRMSFNNARDYRQFGANIYVRLVLDRLGAALAREPQVLASPYAQ